ncbi:Aromatic amino acid aminotransferase [Colletotrichum orbiculare MAFF 240422]|uniref:Aromatic amino acid aminotransferase n=1 Tax=Colletotrichum orbiculare (strain 104-T / ATCC 96160 / CBS 514.97 / LARS 414 / MAFF 240422) TaxID=1213857 RepID=N4VG32_COLOR|nr:Aromatic amino acid aminotransferase [Colletotrichum orbiculare MAFF 240422]
MATARMDFSAKRPPRNLSHHFSEVTKRREASKMKDYYKYFQIPGVGNLAGGLPHASLFPFDTLEAQAAKPERWEPSPIPDTAGGGGGSGDGVALPVRSKPSSSSSDVKAARHVTVPGSDATRDPLRRIDVATALQYGTAEGYPSLRSFVRQFVREHLHPNVPYLGGPEVILSCGSTDGFSKTLELLTNTWNPTKDHPRERPHLICEVFVYGQVLTQALPRGVQVAPVEMDDVGMVAYGAGGLEELLAGWDEENGQRPHFLYTVTMGHNPTSGILPVARRKEIYEICSKYDVVIVEDDPYWYLQYPSAAAGEAESRGSPAPPEQPADDWQPEKLSGYRFLDSLTPSFLQIDVDGRVIRLDTFSKTIAPGCRLGWITAQPAVIERLLRITEVSTQQPSGFVQSTVAELVMGEQPAAARSAFAALTSRQKATFEGWQMDGWVRWLEGLRGVYERRMARMSRILDAGAVQLKQSTPRNADIADWGVVSKTRLYDFKWPRGGMFIWLRVRFETHPLWRAEGGRVIPLLDGEKLVLALLIFATQKPFRVAVSPGLMFSATDNIRVERGWAYLRLCFAAESEENVDLCSQRLSEAIHRFWKIKKVEEIEDLIKDLVTSGEREDEDLGNLGAFMGC